MEQQQSERLVRLEEQARHDRQWVNYHLNGLDQRLRVLETQPLLTPANVLTAWGWLKILLAVCLPLLVLLATGDPRQAIRAATSSLPGPSSTP